MAKRLGDKAFSLCRDACTLPLVCERRKVLGMAGRKSWTIAGMDEQARAEAVAAAERAGMPVHEWIEQAVRQALQPGADHAPPEGVEIEELEAMVRRVVAEELRPMRETLDRLEARAVATADAGGGPVTFTRERIRHRRSR
jgi:hypothetical protein